MSTTERNASPSDRLPVAAPERVPFDKVRFPDLADLLSRLQFSTRDGRIWLDDQRVLLIHGRALGMLRREMIEALGSDTARGLLTRMGYQAGVLDARMARKVRSKMSLKEMFLVGPQMHCLEGVGLSEPVRLDFDVERGTHYGEFVWTGQIEDEEHIRHFPIGTEPACWMQSGYASGFTTEFMGRPMLYREVECQAMGQSACRIVGKPVEEWGEEAAQDVRFTLPAALIGDLSQMTKGPSAAVSLLSEVASEPDSPVGISPGFNSVLHMVRRVAPTQATVLFLGESGVGKEVFARMLHRLSGRSAKPFIALNCAALPEQLVEAELFGVERGAYTGALQSRLGRFERAHGGTLFLDEIGCLTATAQGKLLRALQENEIERLGDSHTRRVDVRVVAATNVDLRSEVESGRFREDLFFRLNVFPIRIGSLRDRREDIPLLMTHFLSKFNRRHGRRLTGFTQRAVDAMLSYDWPGNVRELENVVERGVILAAENTAIDAPHLFTSGERFGGQRFAVTAEGKLVPSETSELATEPESDSDVDRVNRRVNDLLLGEGQVAGDVSLDEIETVLLRKAVERCQGNVSAAARLLGITRPQLVYRLKSRGIVYEGD